MKVFISCPFSGILDEKTKIVKEEYQQFFQQIIEYLEQNEIEHYFAITRERFGLDYQSPEESTKSDYEGVKTSDVLFVIPGNPISGGVHIELGWASSLNKKIHLFLEKNNKYSPVVMGLSSLTKTIYHETEKFPSKQLAKKIIDEIKRELR